MDEDTRILTLLKQHGYSPQVVWDVGASNGSWARQCISVFPSAKYEFFEPLAHAHKDYRDAWQEGGHAAQLTEGGNANLHTIALGNATGTTSMSVFDFAASSTLFGIDNEEVHQCSQMKVEVCTINDAVLKKGIPAPELLKMDVQGFELKILEGAGTILPSVDVILAETWLLRTYEHQTPLLSELSRFLSFHGFEMFDFGTQFRSQAPQFMDCLSAIDVCFVNKRHSVFENRFRTPSAN